MSPVIQSSYFYGDFMLVGIRVCISDSLFYILLVGNVALAIFGSYANT